MGHINTRFLHLYQNYQNNQQQQATQTRGACDITLTPTEKAHIHRLHTKISRGKSNFSFQQFKDYMETVLPEHHIIQRIFQILVAISNRAERSFNSQTALWTTVTGIFSSPANVKGAAPKEEGVTIDGFSSWIRCFLKGDIVAKSHLLIALSCKNLGDRAVSGHNLLKVFELFLNYYFKYISKTEECQSWEKNLPKDNDAPKLAHLFLKEFYKTVKKTCQGQEGKDEETPLHKQMFTAADMESWLPQSPLLLHIYHFVASTCFPIQNPEEEDIRFILSLIPHVQMGSKLCRTELLSFSSILMINSVMPHRLQMSTWSPLFCSSVDGFSFQRFVHHIEDRGPTVIIIKDSEKHIFGGFASHRWNASTNFFGDEECFLFTLAPEFNVFMPSGYNRNCMYFNYGVHTIPCGMGMGGQLSSFGWWINDDFTTGHSQGPCLTFNSPQLSAKRDFKIDKVEVWKIHDMEFEKDEAYGRHHRSTIDRDPAAKAILSLLDRGPHSEGLRQGDSFAQLPDHPQIRF